MSAHGETTETKRRRADSLPQEPPSNKKIKPSGRLPSSSTSNLQLEFWDHLSKVWLTLRALRELDRQNNTQPALEPRAPTVDTKDLGRFARHGGPDLRHLHGCPDSEPKDSGIKMPSIRRTKSTDLTNALPQTVRLSAYDKNFEQHLIDHNVYPDAHEHADGRPALEPGNMDQVRLDLLAPRASSPSPSPFLESAFRDFKRKNNTISEGTVMRNAIPIIAGNIDIPNEGNLPFTNMESIAGEAIVKAVPGFFDGARPSAVDKRVRKDLSQLIMPTEHAGVPAVPNFYLEAKLGAVARVAPRQALHDGAIGARAMHSLQNYGKEEPVYDGNAYTCSSTYHASTGTLQLYAHHVTPPIAPGGRPEYHMTQIDGYVLTGSRKHFVEGVAAFRNARDFAQRHRDKFIHEANATARQLDVPPVNEAET